MYRVGHLILAVFATLFIYPLVRGNEETTQKSNDCIDERTLKGSDGIEFFRVELEANCDIYTYRITCLNKSSIVRIKSTFIDDSDGTSFKASKGREIQVIIEEFTTLSDYGKKLVVMNRWHMNETSNENRIYFSRTADLILSVKRSGNWSDSSLTFTYEEIEFEEYGNDSSEREGKISPWMSMEGRGYRPNCVFVFRINKAENINASSIHLELSRLELDEGIGEFLLVGAGKDIFQGPPPLFISKSQSKKKIKINDENAYIVFVAASTRSHYFGFEITWKYNGTRITREDIIVDPGTLAESNSMPICISNVTAAMMEFNNSENSFKEFRQRVASLGTEYWMNNSKTFNIDASQVHIDRISAVVEEEDLVYVMVKVQHSKKGTPVFDYHQLGHLLNEYSSRFQSNVVDGCKIKSCPKKERKLLTFDQLYVAIPIMCCVIVLLVFNWKNTPFPRMFSKKNRKAHVIPCRTQMVPVEVNEYVFSSIAHTTPKICVTTDNGWQYTYDSGKNSVSSEGEQDSDIEEFSQMDLKRSFSSRSAKKESGCNGCSTGSLQMSHINMGFKMDEEDSGDSKSDPVASTSESLHDSIKSQKRLVAKDINETKL